MKILKFPIYFVGLKLGPMMVRGAFANTPDSLALPIFEKESDTESWVSHYQEKTVIAIGVIKDGPAFGKVLLKAKELGCHWVVWNRRLESTDVDYQDIDGVLRWIQGDSQAN